MTACTEMGHGRLSKLRGWRGKREMGLVEDKGGGDGEGALSVTQVPFPPAMCTLKVVGQGWFVLKERISVPEIQLLPSCPS